jgi:hypothetical protein
VNDKRNLFRIAGGVVAVLVVLAVAGYAAASRGMLGTALTGAGGGKDSAPSRPDEYNNTQLAVTTTCSGGTITYTITNNGEQLPEAGYAYSVLDAKTQAPPAYISGILSPAVGESQTFSAAARATWLWLTVQNAANEQVISYLELCF